MTKREQIEALLSMHPTARIMEHAPRGAWSQDVYPAILTVEPWEILEYAKTNYSLAELFRTSPGPDDGVYVIQGPDSYEVYYQERQIKFPICEGVDGEEAWRRGLKARLDLSGTGYSLREQGRAEQQGRDFFDRSA